MDKFTVARLLDEIARYVELSDPKPFRARAFEKAARAIEGVDDDLAELVESGRIYEVSGVGKATGQIVEELVRTGESRYLDELRAQYPPGIFELLRVPRLGLRKIGQLHADLGIASLDDLEAAATSGRLAQLKGYGAKTGEQILRSIAFARLRESQFLLPIGHEAGESLRLKLAQIDEVGNAEVAGSVRRRLVFIRNVNLVVSTKKPDAVASKLAGLVANLEPVDDTTWKGVIRSELDVLIHLASPANFGSELLRTTGSREFLEAFGKIPKAATEKDAFRLAKQTFVEPERRENGEDLKKKKRPKLIDLPDLRG